MTTPHLTPDATPSEGGFEHPEAQTLTGDVARGAHAVALSETPAAVSLRTGATLAAPPADGLPAPTPAGTFLATARAAFEAMDGTAALNGAFDSVKALRRAALGHALRLGLPTRRSEAWKYTPIERIAERAWRIPTPADAAAADDPAAPLVPGHGLAEGDADLVVLVNGRFDATRSRIGALPGGAFVGALSTLPEALRPTVEAKLGTRTRIETEVFSALSTAFMADAAVVVVPAGVALDRPVVVLHTAAGADVFVATRLLVVAEAGAEATVLETAFSRTDGAATFFAPVTEAFVAEGATVRHIRVQNPGHATVEVTSLEAHQTGTSVFDTLTLGISGEVVRNHIRILPDARGCESHLRGLFLAGERRHVDNATFVDHAVPECDSNELYKTVLFGSAKGVFNGRILVRKDAQKTNAYQSSRALVLGDGAEMASKPELEIYADDVKCSHGAATGRLDDSAMFYLRQRGLTVAQARALLLVAFARDVTSTIALPGVRTWVDETIETTLGDLLSADASA